MCKPISAGSGNLITKDILHMAQKHSCCGTCQMFLAITSLNMDYHQTGIVNVKNLDGRISLH